MNRRKRRDVATMDKGTVCRLPGVSGAAVSAANPYVLTGLGFLPGSSSSQAAAISDDGLVVGYSTQSSTGDEHAFLWQTGTGMQDLNPLLGQTISFAAGINSSGQVVGGSATTVDQPFLWQSGSPPQFFANPGDSAYAINDSGQVVGTTDDHAFIWQSGGSLQMIGPAGFLDSYASGINAAGQVAETASTASGVNQAFLWQSGSGAQGLGFLPGGTQSFATAVNQKRRGRWGGRGLQRRLRCLSLAGRNRNAEPWRTWRDEQ